MSEPSTDGPATDPRPNLVDTGAAHAASDPLPSDGGAAVKDPDEWTTGDEPMTDAQRSYLQTLAQQHGRELPADPLTKAEASKLIDSLKGEG
jgi:hypothetical protein